VPLAIISAMVRRSSSVMPGSMAGGARRMDVLGWPRADRDPAHLALSDVGADLEAESVAIKGQGGIRVIVAVGRSREW